MGGANKVSQSTLEKVVKGNHVEVLALLVKYKITEYAFREALLNEYFEFANLLLPYNIMNLNVQDEWRRTLLHDVAARADLNLAFKACWLMYLTKYGADLSIRDNEGKTPWDIVEQHPIIDINSKTGD